MKKRLKFFSVFLALILITLMSMVSLEAPKLIADDDSQSRDDSICEAESTAEYFIEYYLAKNGSLLDCDFYAEETDNLKSFMKVRNAAILNRRAALAIGIVDFDVDLDKTAEMWNDNSVVYFFKSEERTKYSSPNVTSSITGFYLVELINEGGEWKVLNCLSTDEYFYSFITFAEILEEENNVLDSKYSTSKINELFSNLDFDKLEEQYDKSLQQSLQDSVDCEENPAELDSVKDDADLDRVAIDLIEVLMEIIEALSQGLR